MIFNQMAAATVLFARHLSNEVFEVNSLETKTPSPIFNFRFKNVIKAQQSIDRSNVEISINLMVNRIHIHFCDKIKCNRMVRVALYLIKQFTLFQMNFHVLWIFVGKSVLKLEHSSNLFIYFICRIDIHLTDEKNHRTIF